MDKQVASGKRELMHQEWIAAMGLCLLVAGCATQTLKMSTASTAQPPKAGTEAPAPQQQSDGPCTREWPGYKRIGPVALEGGSAWGLTPASDAEEQAAMVCYAPTLEGRPTTKANGSPVVRLPAFTADGDRQARVYLTDVKPAGGWVVIADCWRVPGWAQPSGCKLEGAKASTGERITVWQGLVTGGSHMVFAAGPGAVIFSTGSTSANGISVDEFTLVRLNDNSRQALAIDVWPRDIVYKDQGFIVTGVDQKIYEVNPQSGEVRQPAFPQ